MKGSKHRVTTLRGSIGRSVARNNKNAIVKKIMANVSMRKKVLLKVSELIKKELKDTCLINSKSVFKDKSISQIQSFDWSTVANNLHRTAPTLHGLLDNCCLGKEITIVVLAGIMLHRFSEKANLVQTLFSTILYCNHCPKQVLTWYFCIIMTIFFVM